MNKETDTITNIINNINNNVDINVQDHNIMMEFKSLMMKYPQSTKFIIETCLKTKNFILIRFILREYKKYTYVSFDIYQTILNTKDDNIIECIFDVFDILKQKYISSLIAVTQNHNIILRAVKMCNKPFDNSVIVTA